MQKQEKLYPNMEKNFTLSTAMDEKYLERPLIDSKPADPYQGENRY
jgi:hypothetical protein